MPLAVETFRFRKMPSGMSGAAMRDSRTRNATKSPTAMPSSPSVCAAIQPCSSVFTIA